jgi:hypothetical protein
MAVEKAALDLTDCSMAECRKGLNHAVDELEKVVKSVPKAAVRRRIREATEKVKFDQIIVVESSKR